MAASGVPASTTAQQELPTDSAEKVHLVNLVKKKDKEGKVLEGNVNGNAGTATKLQTSRTIAGNVFDGTDNIQISAFIFFGEPSQTDKLGSPNTPYT